MGELGYLTVTGRTDWERGVGLLVTNGEVAGSRCSWVGWPD